MRDENIVQEDMGEVGSSLCYVGSSGQLYLAHVVENFGMMDGWCPPPPFEDSYMVQAFRVKIVFRGWDLGEGRWLYIYI